MSLILSGRHMVSPKKEIYNLAKTLGVLVAQNLSQGVEQKGESSLFDLIWVLSVIDVVLIPGS